MKKTRALHLGAYGASMTSQTPSRFGPVPIVIIHALAGLGIVFWLSQIVSALIDGTHVWVTLGLGLILGGAHVAIWRMTSLHSTHAIWAMWFVFVGDSVLTIFVNWHAIVLVAATVALLLLAHMPSARRWFTSPS